MSEPTMNEIIVCPKCKRRLNVQVEHLGKTVQCPTCETMFIAGETNPRPELPPPAPDAVTPKPAATSPSGQKRRSKSDDADEPRPRRSRRLDSGKPPTRWKPGHTVALTLASVAAVVGVLIVIVVLIDDMGPPKMPIANFAPNNLPVVPPPPPIDVPDRMLNVQEQQQHAKAFFDHFGAVMCAPGNQGEPEMACFDSARLLDNAFQEKLIPAALQIQRDRLVDDFRTGVLQTSMYRGALWWGAYDIKTIKQPRARELIVVTHHTNQGGGFILRLRWWLAHRDRRWLVTDMESIEYGIHLSTMLAGAQQPADPAVQTLHDAVNAIMLKNDINAADRILGPVQAADLPKACAVPHHLITATIRQRQGRNEEMLAASMAANRLDPDAPGADYLCAVACNELFRGAEALKHARAAQAWLGADPLLDFEFGRALHHQNQFGKAAPFYRSALDGFPNNKTAFLGLLRCVGPEVKNDDIAARFLKMANPEGQFQEFASDCWKFRNHSNVKALADAMLQRAPRNADAHYYQALVHADQERIPAAAAAFQAALAFQTFEPRRELYYTEFAQTLVFRDQAVQAYRVLADQQRSFRALGNALKNSFKMDALQELIDVHVKNHPRDPYLHLFQAEIHLIEEQYKQADQAYSKAFAVINEPALLERYRYSRIRARYEMGDTLGAYRDIGPSRMAFQQLATSCWLDRKPADLRALVTAHEGKDPFDAQLPRFKWRVAIFDKRFDEAAASFKTALKQNLGGRPDRQFSEDFLFDMIDAGHPLEGYRHATDRHEAVDIIGLDLANAYRDAELETVLNEHRQGFPNDPILLMYAGRQATLKQDWARSAAKYRAGWKQLPEARRPNWIQPYLFAHVKAGEAVQAYDEMGQRPEHFHQLASLLLAEKDIDAFERLVETHRPHSANDPEFAAYDARLKVLRGKSAQAAELLLGLLKDRPIHDQRRIGDSFLNQLAPFDVAVEAYRSMPDKRDAFAQMVWRYRQPERVKEFARLIAEHAREHANDPFLLEQRAELRILEGNFALAAQEFGAARLKNPQDQFARLGYIRARIKLGKTADTYRELGPSAQTFLDIASQCATLKDGVELDRLLVAHREAFPDAKNLAMWDLEALWQKKDYEAAVKAIQADRARLLKNQTWRWKCEGYLVRGLVRLKKTEQAVQEAETITRRKDGSQILLALAVASDGDVPRFLEFMDTKKVQRYFVEDCYRDEDLGPLLRSDAFRAVQNRYPPPTGPSLPNGRFDDDWD